MSARPVVQLFSNPRAGTYRARRVRALVRALEAQGATVDHVESRDETRATAKLSGPTPAQAKKYPSPIVTG